MPAIFAGVQITQMRRCNSSPPAQKSVLSVSTHSPPAPCQACLVISDKPSRTLFAALNFVALHLHQGCQIFLATTYQNG
jgi:hypothetical protein